MSNIFGTNGNDVIWGTPLDDFILGKKGADEIFGKDGADELFGGKGDDWLEGGIGNDWLEGGKGHDVLYGGDGNDGLEGGKGDDWLDGGIGNDWLDGGKGKDVLQGGDGNDELTGGKGNDRLYGDLETEAIDVTTDDPTAGMLDTSIEEGVDGVETIVTYGDDEITAGKGDDVASGDIGELRLSVKSGDVDVDGGDSHAFIVSKTFEMGDDHVYGGSGKDELYGDVELINLHAEAGDVTVDGRSDEVGQSGAFLFGPSFIMGDDHLDGGSDDDKLFGDVGEFRLVTLGGDQFSASTPGSAVAEVISGENEFSFIAGADNLEGGSGNDFLYGDIGHLNMEIVSGDKDFRDSNHAAVAEARFAFGEADVISDVLDGGHGDDHIYGDIGLWTISAEAGAIAPDLFVTNAFIVASAYHAANTYTFSADHLLGGKGDDHLYGDVGSILIDAMGGTSHVDPGQFGFALNAAYHDEDNTYVFGHDLLEGGKGNDWIYGDIGQLEVTLSSEDTMAEEQHVSNKSFTLGDDTLQGGDGNDHIFGDIGESQSLDLFVNTEDPLGQGYPDSEVKFGDDILYGGKGDDVLVGDIRGYINSNLLTDADPNDTSFNTAIWGNDQLFGEKGNDRLEGSLGNDVLDGGKGDDILIGGPTVGPQVAPPVDIGDIDDVGLLATNLDEIQMQNNTLLTAQVIDRADFGDITGGTASNPTFFDIPDVPSMSVSGLSTNVNNNGVTSDQYDGPFDVDVYEIELNQGENLTIDVDDDLTVAGTDTLDRFDTTIFVYDSAGVLVGSQDDVSPDSGDIDDATSRLDFIAPGDGTFFIAVTPFYNTGTGVPDINVDVLDEIEPNDGGDLTTVAYQLSLSLSLPVTVGPAAEDNDVLTGGSGDDIFVFNLGDDAGALGLFNDDIVTDFDIWDDTLEFNGVIDLNGDLNIDALDLDMAADVDMSGPDVVITFEEGNGGSVTLEGQSDDLMYAGITETSFFQDLDDQGALNVNVVS